MFIITRLVTACLHIPLQDQESYFHEALDRWRELNLSPAFVQFARQTATLSASLPLLLHHWKDVVEAWETAISVADDEAMKPLLECVIEMLCRRSPN
jgi:U3 small nucleolar RNA-associated protein 20